MDIAQASSHHGLQLPPPLPRTHENENRRKHLFLPHSPPEKKPQVLLRTVVARNLSLLSPSVRPSTPSPSPAASASASASASFLQTTPSCFHPPCPLRRRAAERKFWWPSSPSVPPSVRSTRIVGTAAASLNHAYGRRRLWLFGLSATPVRVLLGGGVTFRRCCCCCCCWWRWRNSIAPRRNRCSERRDDPHFISRKKDNTNICTPPKERDGVQSEKTAKQRGEERRGRRKRENNNRVARRGKKVWVLLG